MISSLWFRTLAYLKYLFTNDPVERYFNYYSAQFEQRALQYERTIEILTLQLKEKDSEYRDLQNKFVQTLLDYNTPEESAPMKVNFNSVSRRPGWDHRRRKLEEASKFNQTTSATQDKIEEIEKDIELGLNG